MTNMHDKVEGLILVSFGFELNLVHLEGEGWEIIEDVELLNFEWK